MRIPQWVDGRVVLVDLPLKVVTDPCCPFGQRFPCVLPNGDLVEFRNPRDTKP